MRVSPRVSARDGGRRAVTACVRGGRSATLVDHSRSLLGAGGGSRSTLGCMTSQTPLIASEGHARLAREFIAESHRGLPMVRILLPMRGGHGGSAVRWSEYVALDEELASLDWWDVVERNAEDRPEIRDLVSCRGELDAVTVQGLSEAVGDAVLTSLRWLGYAEARFTGEPVRVLGNDFFPAVLRREDLRVGERVPEFAWDENGTIAWGAHLYPDSLILAGDIARVRRVHADPRLDTIVVRPHEDVLPPSSGD